MRESGTGGPESSLPPRSFRWDKARGGDEGCPGEPERPGRARPAAANSPAGARGLSQAGGRERARGGGGREPRGAEAGRKGPSPCGQREGEEGVPPKPRPPRSGAPRPAPPAALPPPSLPGRGWGASRRDTSYLGSQLRRGRASSSSHSRAGSADPRPSPHSSSPPLRSPTTLPFKYKTVLF